VSLRTAIATGDLAELPSRRDEDWRWTDLRGLIRQLPERSANVEEALAAGPFDALADQTAVIVNGQARAQLPMRIEGDRVLALRIVGLGEGAHAAVLTLHVEHGRLTLLESYEGGEGGYLSELDLKLTIGAGATVERIVLADAMADAVNVSRADVTLAPGARFSQSVVAGGAKRQRLETHVAHQGGGAAAMLDGLYIVGERRHCDITTVVTHACAGGATDQLTKGVVTGQARGVFQGRIVVAEGADKTDARMRHHALVLGDRAEVDAKPELDIFADDVACAHGNTVGALDEDALFYAEQRGVPTPEARAMLTEAFLVEVADRIDHAGAREVVRRWVTAQLERGSSEGAT
jgi:Fe-S cluster assembly protein SufD